VYGGVDDNDFENFNHVFLVPPWVLGAPGGGFLIPCTPGTSARAAVKLGRSKMAAVAAADVIP
jgi:hypothetical protein